MLRTAGWPHHPGWHPPPLRGTGALWRGAAAGGAAEQSHCPVNWKNPSQSPPCLAADAPDWPLRRAARGGVGEEGFKAPRRQLLPTSGSREVPGLWVWGWRGGRSRAAPAYLCALSLRPHRRLPERRGLAGRRGRVPGARHPRRAGPCPVARVGGACPAAWGGPAP